LCDAYKISVGELGGSGLLGNLIADVRIILTH
jgi:hypothetical protein